MIWAYSPWRNKVHCFVPMKNPELYVSLCKRAVSFTIDPVNETEHEQVGFCFNCLLAFIQKGDVKP